MSEQDIINYWREKDLRKKALKKNSGKQKYYFLDGPPYATGYIHMGTAFNKILKDYYIRFLRMKGFDVWAQPGYDTHGLPIEIKVEKQMGLHGKDDIEKIGIDKFNKECADYATKFISVMNEQFDNLGVWMDWENPYVTLKNSYIESAWHTFKMGFKKGLLYKGTYPLHVCPSCETVVAYNEIEYEKRKDTSVYVKFRLKNRDNEFLLIWTTTPWTLPANTGVMVHPKFEYALVETMAGKLWIAKELVPTVMEKMESGYTILQTIQGKEMDGWEYDHPMKIPVQEKVNNRVIMSDRYVHLEGGTGLVHTAPGHGEEDWRAGKEAGLDILCPVKTNGHYDDTVGKYANLFVKDADSIIINDLRESGHLLLAEEFEHDYPICWRCRSPLLFLNMPQWFFKVSDMKDELIKQNASTPWVPAWAGKRFENWLKSLSDWPISRQRYWGIPLPIWECECGEVKVVGSTDELPSVPENLHRPYIDEIKLKCSCGRDMQRVPDVLDVWFDSGTAPWASLGYPREKEPFESLWPVKFVLEGPDQTRGWWNSLSICGYITFGRIPFDNILQHGLVLSEGGVKMSKSRGNIVSPEEVIKKHSRDTLRYYLLMFDPSADFDWSWEKVNDVNKFFTILRNLFNFFTLYCQKAELKNPQPEDLWMLSRVNAVIAEATEYNNKFLGYKAVTTVSEFVMNDLSRWYIKLIRDRTWPGYSGADKNDAFATLYYVLERVNRLLAPVIPFLTEEFNQLIFGEESVHLSDWPVVEDKWLNPSLEQEMTRAREITEQVATLRQEAGVKLRWPLKRLTVPSDELTKRVAQRFNRVLCSQCNVKEVVVGEALALDTEMDDALTVEALASDVMRQVQSMRKKMGLNVEDTIHLYLAGHDLLSRIRPLIEKKVNAASVVIGYGGQEKAKLEFAGSTIVIGVSK